MGTVAQQLRHNAIQKSIIIGNRIVFERLMDLIYFSFTNADLNRKCGKSKKNFFVKWLYQLPSTDNLQYLLPVLIIAKHYDDDLRTAEVHMGSKLKTRALCLVKPTSDDFNIGTVLQSYIMNLLPNLPLLMDDKRPSTYSWSKNDWLDIDHNWADAYCNKDENKLTYYREKWKEELNIH